MVKGGAVDLRAAERARDDANYPVEADDDVPTFEGIVECASAPWHAQSHPSCNAVHEMDLQTVAHIDSGGFNDVLCVVGGGPILKILSPGKKHPTGTPPIRVYKAAHFEVVRGWTLDRALKAGFAAQKRKTARTPAAAPADRLRYATQTAEGLADNDRGVVHADLTIKQYMIRNGALQLGDFNRGILLHRNASAADGSSCTSIMKHHYGTARAPEEYRLNPQTVKVDVWNLGSIIYHLLTGNKVWHGTKKDAAQEAVIQGKRPRTSDVVRGSKNPANRAMLQALDMIMLFIRIFAARARSGTDYLTTGTF